MVNHSFPTREVKIRKERRCYGCGDKHEKGSSLHHDTGVSEDGFWHAYFCNVCKAFLDTIKWEDYEDGIGPSDLLEDMRYLPFRQKFINGLLS